MKIDVADIGGRAVNPQDMAQRLRIYVGRPRPWDIENQRRVRVGRPGP